MFHLVEFTDFSSQINNFFTHTDLEPIRYFYKCLEEAEDSALGLTSKTLKELKQELQTAVKVDGTESTEVSRIGVYRTPLKSSIQIKINQNKINCHQQRKKFIHQITSPKSTYLKDFIERHKDHSDLSRKLQYLIILARDPSIHFESFTTEAIVKIREIMQKVPFLVNHLKSIQEKIWVKAKKSNLSIYTNSIRYLDKLGKNLTEIKEAWCENILDRLEKASFNKDIYYSDNLHQLITEINRQITDKKEQIIFPEKERRDLSKNNFIEAQKIIIQYGTTHQKKRLYALSWNKDNDHFVKFPAGSSTHIAPTSIAPLLIQRLNWFYYLCFASYRYRYHFLDRYAHLIAQQKLLSETKKIKNTSPLSLTECHEFKKLNSLEQEIKQAQAELQLEVEQENFKWIKSASKQQLITHYLSSLRQSLLFILEKKIDILTQYAEPLKIYVYIPELSKATESRNFNFYQQASQREAMLSLHQEITNKLTELNPEEAYSLNNKFRLAHNIITHFYKLKPNTTIVHSTRYEIYTLEELSSTPLNDLFLLELDKIKLKLEHYRCAYQQLIVKSNELSRRAIEQSLYRFIIHYLEFVQEHIDELTPYDEKLEIIENNLIATNPITAGYLQETQNLRRSSTDPSLKFKLQLQCQVMIAAVQPEIKKQTFSEVLVRSSSSPTHPLENLTMAQTKQFA